MQKLTTWKSLARRAGLAKMGLVILAGLAVNLGRAQDSFADAQVLPGNPWGAVTNDNTGVTNSLGAPNIAGFPPNHQLWYKWTAPNDGDVELDTVGSIETVTNITLIGFDTNSLPIFSTNVDVVNMDTVLGVYQGSDSASLNQIAANDDLYPVNSSLAGLGGSIESPVTEEAADTGFIEPYYGPSHLRFTAKGGQTYYFAEDTKSGSGNISMNWAYKSSGVFRFASEDKDNGTGLPLYQTAETESQPPAGSGNVDVLSVETTYYNYNAPGALVTVTRAAGSTGRAIVDYQTEDGTSMSLPPNTEPAVAGSDYIPVSGELVFDDFEMSKTILIPIIYHGARPADQMNRIFGITLSNPQLDGYEDGSAVSPPRVDPLLGTAMVKILDTDADPYGPDMISVVSTNGYLDPPTNTMPNVVTNPVVALYPTNYIFNFEKANYRVPADVNDSAIAPYNYATATLYVERGGTNTGAMTINYTVNSTLDNDSDVYGGNNQFPLQPGSDYAVPLPADQDTIVRNYDTTNYDRVTTNYDFHLARGTISFPSSGAGEFYQPIHITIPISKATKFNKDFRIELYREVKVGNQDVPEITGMNAEATVTILFNDENPPAGSVDEFYNADFNTEMALLPSRQPSTVPGDNSNPGVGTPVFPGQIYGIAALTNDEAFIGGDFPTYNGVARSGVALIQADGQLDTSFDPGSGVSGDLTRQGNDARVNAVAVSGNQFYVGGNFTAYDSALVSGIGRLNADGTLDTAFNVGNGADGAVRAILVLTNGEVLIGGDFTHINGTACNYIALLNTNGSLDASFNPTNNLTGSVYTLAMQGSQILVGGNFSVTGQTYHNIARLNADGALDTTFNPGTGPNNIVHALICQADGKIIAGGEFTTVNGLSYNHIVRFNADGSIDANFFVGSGADDVVYSLSANNVITSTTNLVVTGGVTNTVINTLTNYSIYAGGAFESFNGTHRRGFTRLYSDGTVDTTFMDTAYNQFAGLKKIFSWDSPAIFASAVQDNGGVLIGGSFVQVGGGEADPDVCNSLDEQLYSGGILDSFGDPNLWVEPKTRDGVRNRTGFARLIGGATPGPGNISLGQNSYSQNKSQSTLTVSLVRTNGMLGPVSANFSVQPELALAGKDYFYQSASPLYWIGWNYINSPTRMREDGLWGVSGNGLLRDALGQSLTLADATVNNLAKVTVGVIRNPSNPGNLNAQFQLANPSTADTFYLGGEEIPLGAALGVSSAPFTLIDDTTSPGQFGFSASSFVATNLSPTITVVRSNGTFGVVSMNYSATNGTAVAGTDYRATTGRLVFNTGITSTNFTVAVLNDGFITNVEKIVNLKLVNLGTTPNATFGISNAVLRIINPNFQGYVTLSDTNYIGTVSSGTLTFTINRVSGSLGTVSLQYGTVSGSGANGATNGVDYTGSTNLLTWIGGDVSPKTVSIPLLPTQNIGGSKQFSVKLFNPSSPSLMGVISDATLTITNDNSSGSLQFGAPIYTVNENGGYATIPVIRTSGAAGTISAVFATSDGTAIAGTNYTATTRSFTLQPGQLSTNFTIAILDDHVVDPAPSAFYFNVSLFGPGTSTSAVVQIVDAESYNQPPGSIDPSFDSDGVNGDVFALSLNSSGQILAGGNFTAVGTTARGRIARLNTDGTLDAGFLNGLDGANAAVNAVVCQTDDRILVGGAFSTIDDNNRFFIARLMNDGTLDTSFNPGAGADSVVNAIAETFASSGTGLVRKIYIGGAFSSFNGNPSSGIERLNNDGTVDYGFNVGTGADGPVYAVAVYPTNSIYWGKVLVGGSFAHFNGATIPNLVRLNADGSLDNTFNSNLGAGPNDVVRALAIQADGAILAGGNFTNFNGTLINRIVRINADGTLDANFIANTTAGANDTVEAIALQPDNRIVLGGQFILFNGVTRNRITRLLPTGATDPTINFGFGANGDVASAVVQPADGKIVIGGGFTQFNNQPENRIARIYGNSIAGSGAFEFDTPEYRVDENGIAAAITILRTGGTSGPNADGSGDVFVNFVTRNGTAKAGVNYLGVNTNVDFPPGEISKTVLVPVLDDSTITPDLTVTLNLTNPTSPAVLGVQQPAQLTILNDDSAVAFSSAFYTQVKNTPTGLATINVARQGSTNNSCSVDFYTITNGTAVAGTDYYPTNATIVFSPGQSVAQALVPIINNGLVEGNTTVALLLTNAVNTQLSSPSNATLTIIDTVAAPGQLSFQGTNYVVNEGDGNAILTVVRTNGSSGSVSATWTPVPGTAQPNINYISPGGTVTFGNGETTKTITIPLVDNNIVQGPVSLSVVLSNPTGGSTLTAPTSAELTIMDNDTGFAFLNGTNFVTETNGFVPIFVQRIGATNGGVQVSYSSENGTAEDGVNYHAVSGTLNFAAGEMLKAISQPLIYDPQVTGNLDFTMMLSGASPGTVLVSPSNTVVRIQDADAGLSFTNSTMSVFKNDNNAVITIVCSNPAIEPVLVDTNVIPLSVNYYTSDGTAVAGVDYSQVSGTMFFTNGIGTNTFNVPIINNSLVQGNLNFSVNLSSPTAPGQLTWPSNQVVTIIDDNSGLNFSSPVYSVLKTGVAATITVLRSDNTNTTSAVNFATSDGTAIAGTDYISTNGILVFTNGEISKTFAVTVIANTTVQPDKTVLLQLSNPTNGFLTAPYAATLTIHDTSGSFVVPAGSTFAPGGDPNANGIIDPGENVSLLFAFRAAGGTNVGDLKATLLVTNGIANPSAQQDYGSLIVDGPSVSRQFSFTANGTNSQRIVATFKLQDGSNVIGTNGFTYSLGTWTTSYTNTNSIVINDDTMASPYPSILNVTNVGGTIIKATITLTNLSHTSPGDIDALLVSPAQQDTLIMAHAGGQNVAKNITLTFDDASTNTLPQNNPLVSGTNKPTAYLPQPQFP